MWNLRRKRIALVAATSVALAGAVTPQLGLAQETQSATTNETYCERRLGTWFYCEAPKPLPRERRPRAGEDVAKPPAVVELEAFQKALNEARQTAVWEPTPANVERYYRLQRVALDKGGLFADLYRRLVWTNPDLDYTLKRPVMEVGKGGWTDDRLADRDLVLRAANARVGLFYVYAGDCAACRIASPIVANFSRRFGMPVKAISTDGQPNAHFQNVVANSGQLEAWGLRKVTPALLFFQESDLDPRTGQRKPPLRVKGASGVLEFQPCLRPQGCITYAGAGVMAEDDIAERLFVLLVKPPGEDF